MELLGGRHPSLQGTAASHSPHPDHLHLAVAGLGVVAATPAKVARAAAGASIGSDLACRRRGLRSGRSTSFTWRPEARAKRAKPAPWCRCLRSRFAPPARSPRPRSPGRHGLGSRRECLTAASPPGLVDHRRHMGLKVGVDPDGDRACGCWHALHDRSVRAARTATARTHRDGGQHGDGPLGQAPIGSLRPTGGCLLCPLRQLADRSNPRHQTAETSGQTSPEGHHPDHRSKKLLYHLKASPAGGLRPPSGPAAARRPPGHRLTFHTEES